MRVSQLVRVDEKKGQIREGDTEMGQIRNEGELGIENTGTSNDSRVWEYGVRICNVRKIR